MESLSETPWDVVIEGTGLRQSLLALALSRSEKKILHVDESNYYGGPEAAFSLQEVDEWLNSVIKDPRTGPFQHASLWKNEDESVGKLSLSRAYTLALSPQIIYAKSKLLSQLVSSKIYKQLEFQAVGNWWIYDKSSADDQATLKRLPNGREDIFEDKNIDLRAKRSLMKFLKFVIDYQNQGEVWEASAEDPLPAFLASQFKLPSNLQTIIIALALSLNTPDATKVGYALPRIARHLTSIGVFGPGFGAVFPKWGGSAEIAQVACRACAVGGGVYVLGTGISSTQAGEEQSVQVTLSDGEVVKTQRLAWADSTTKSTPQEAEISTADDTNTIARVIAITSSPLLSLFESTVEGSPLAAVTVVAFPSNSLTRGDLSQAHPVYIMAHSSETGECPAGQCVLYATTSYSSSSKTILEEAIAAFLKLAEDGQGKLLYSLYYEQKSTQSSELDLAFNDEVLDVVEEEWKTVLGEDAQESKFMQLEERAGTNEDDYLEADDNDY